MATSQSCEATRSVAAELALGVAAGDERARAVQHIEQCGDCRRYVESLVETVDEILLLAPEREPPLGFEAKVMGRLGRAPRRRWPRVVAAAAAAVVIAVAAVWGTLAATSSERQLGGLYRTALERAEGLYFGAELIHAPDGSRSGHMFVYRGEPSWVFIVVDDPAVGGDLDVEILTRAGETRAIGTLDVRGGRAALGLPLPVDLADVELVRLSDEGGVPLEAEIPAP